MLASKIKALFCYYQTFRGLPTKTCKGKRKRSFYFDNKDIFQVYKAQLLQQDVKTITFDNFRITINIKILPRLIVLIDKGISRAYIYKWLP